MHITLRQLKIFKVVAQYGRVTAAAKALAISQPAVSMAIAEMEKHLGALFDRHHSGLLYLNDTGRTLLPWADEFEARIDELVFMTQSSLSKRAVPITLDASSTIGNNLLPRIVASFMSEYPNLDVNVHIDNTRIIEERILSFKTDIGLVEGTCLHSNIEVTTWLEDELVIICHPEHPLAGTVIDSVAQLSNEYWILREAGSGTRELFDEVIAPKLSPPLEVMILNRSEAIKQAVSHQLGIACISNIAVEGLIKVGSLSVINVCDLSLKRHFYLLSHRKKYMCSILQALRQSILSW